MVNSLLVGGYSYECSSSSAGAGPCRHGFPSHATGLLHGTVVSAVKVAGGRVASCRLVQGLSSLNW